MVGAVGSSRRVLVLGLDGGTFDLLDPLFAAGELPFLHSLADRGFRAPLRSVYPAKTIPAWYSFATGRDPGELGIFGFAEPGTGPGRSTLVGSFRPQEAVWDRLSRVGRTVGVVNFPIRAGYPVHGFVLPGMLAERPTTYPKGLRDEVERELGEPYPGELPSFDASKRDAWVAAATRAVATRARAAARLAERHRPDFLFALFRETDRVQHQLWGELSRPVVDLPPDLLGFWREVDDGCRAVHDAFALGGGPSLTLVVSDHGHGPIESDFFTNRWLASERFLVLNRGAEPTRRRALPRIALAAQHLPGAARLSVTIAGLLRGGRFPRLAARLSRGRSFEEMAPSVDWRRSVAFSYPVPEGIYLNPFNPELTDARREQVLRTIRAKLERFPEAVIEVLGPSELYRGRNLGRAPALFIRVDGMTTEPRMDFGYPDPLLRERPRYFYGSGTHRMDGILLGAGDGVPAGTRVAPRHLLDVAPTILEAMGVAPDPSLAGRSFAEELGVAP